MDNLVSYNAVCLCSGATVYLVYPDMRFLQPKAYPTVMRRLKRRSDIVRFASQLQLLITRLACNPVREPGFIQA